MLVPDGIGGRPIGEVLRQLQHRDQRQPPRRPPRPAPNPKSLRELLITEQLTQMITDRHRQRHIPPGEHDPHRAPRDVHEVQTLARAEQDTKDWQTKYALRAGVEGTIRQSVAVAVTDIRHARYRGLAKTRLEHVYSAVALNLIRLNSYWNGHPLDRTRTSHLARLELALAA